MTSTTAVIAAGGFGSRCGSGGPKSLLRAGKRTYLEELLVQLGRSGVTEALLYCNRSEYLDRLLDLSEKIIPSRVFLDGGVESTIALAKHSASVVSSSNILFCYGHAPRPSQHFDELLSYPESPVVTIVESSTKTAPILCQEGGYIEPPYSLTASSLLRTSARDWARFFGRERGFATAISVEGPGEFNYNSELRDYTRYMGCWTHGYGFNKSMGSDA